MCFSVGVGLITCLGQLSNLECSKLLGFKVLRLCIFIYSVLITEKKRRPQSNYAHYSVIIYYSSLTLCV